MNHTEKLAYDGVEVPYLTKYYRNTVVGYSYSKSLSLPEERIGYLVIPVNWKTVQQLLQQQRLQIVYLEVSTLRL